MGARANLMLALKEEAQKVHGGRYWVKRGYVNWSAFAFATHPFAMTIGLAEDDLIPAAGPGRPIGETRGTLLFEVACKIPQGGEEPDADDGLLEEFKDDLVEVLARVLQRTRDGFPVAFAVHPNQADANEWHDSDEGTQGITARVVVSF